jgi:hypothetical protein
MTLHIGGAQGSVPGIFNKSYNKTVLKVLGTPLDLQQPKTGYILTNVDERFENSKIEFQKSRDMIFLEKKPPRDAASSQRACIRIVS